MCSHIELHSQEFTWQQSVPKMEQTNHKGKRNTKRKDGKTDVLNKERAQAWNLRSIRRIGTSNWKKESKSSSLQTNKQRITTKTILCCTGSHFTCWTHCCHRQARFLAEVEVSGCLGPWVDIYLTINEEWTLRGQEVTVPHCQYPLGLNHFIWLISFHVKSWWMS